MARKYVAFCQHYGRDIKHTNFYKQVLAFKLNLDYETFKMLVIMYVGKLVIDTTFSHYKCNMSESVHYNLYKENSE